MRFVILPSTRSSGRADVLEFTRSARIAISGPTAAAAAADLGQPMRGVPALAQVAACQIGRPLRDRAAAVGLRSARSERCKAGPRRAARRVPANQAEDMADRSTAW